MAEGELGARGRPGGGAREGAQAQEQLPQIPGYRIEGLLGSGSTGVVYRARQVSVDRVVALKILRKELGETGKARLRLQREARATAKLAHPNIVAAIDMGEVDGTWWYAMELVDGRPLHKILAAERLPEREVLRLFIPLVEALRHLADRGVVHRDIKPSNILVDELGRARLVDLGLAHADDDPDITNHGGTLGTPHYISPEQARDPGSADAQSDLWSLGATMYHAACGRPPFHGESVAEILSAVLHDKVRDPGELTDGLSGGFVLVLRKCLVRDRARRYRDPAELLADLERVRERRAPLVSRRGLDPLRRDPRRLAWTAAWTAGLCGSVALLLLGVTRGGIVGPEAEPPASDPREALVSALEAAGAAELPEVVALLARSEPLERGGSLPDDQARRLSRARAALSDRLDGELWRLAREFDAQLEALLAERRHDEAALLVSESWPRLLRAKVGGARLLPEAEERGLAAREERWRRRVEESRAAGLDGLRAALVEAWRVEARPLLEDDLRRGAWRAALARLERADADWPGWRSRLAAHASARSVDEVESSVRRDELAPARAELLARWTEADQRAARDVEDAGARIEARLRAGDALEAKASLRDAWREIMARWPLLPGEEPDGFPRAAAAAVERESARLAALATSLPASEAERAWTRLLRERDELCAGGRRDWFGAAELVATRAEEAWAAPVRPALRLLERRLRLLHGLLARAARGLASREGSEVELSAGSLRLRGIVRLGAGWAAPDPADRGDSAREAVADWARPFGLVVSSGAAPWPLRLRDGGADAEGALVDSSSLVALAGLDMADARDALVLVALHLEDADWRALERVLESGAADRDDPLVWLARAQLVDGLRALRAATEERVRVARRDAKAGVEPARLAARIDDILVECGADLRDEEARELRALKAALARPANDAQVADVGALGADDVRLGPDGAAVLSYKLGERAGGWLESGAWIRAKDGWSAPRSLRDDELLLVAGPTLPLDPPLDARAPLTARIRLASASSEPLDLVMLSVAGVHALVVFDRAARSARVLLDAAEEKDLAALVRRARAGEGRLAQLSGDEVELSLHLTRKGDVVRFEVDGRALVDRLLRPPGAARQAVQWRSTRPARVRELLLEARTR
jgi:serine/threonine-protein kinase